VYFRDRDSIHSAEYPLVQEMTSVLREWGIMWKHLYLVMMTVKCIFLYEDIFNVGHYHYFKMHLSGEKPRFIRHDFQTNG
jgi:hypothetical protein